MIPDGPACRPNWVRYNASCYLIEKTSLDWAAAGAVCKSLNAYLVEIETLAEMSFLVKFLDYNATFGAWTGGLDIGLVS